MKFKPEDFDLQIKLSMTSDILNKKAAEMANAKLQEWLDAAPTVYHRDGIPYEDGGGWDDMENLSDGKLKAKLVCIEEIK